EIHAAAGVAGEGLRVGREVPGFRRAGQPVAPAVLVVWSLGREAGQHRDPPEGEVLVLRDIDSDGLAASHPDERAIELVRRPRTGDIASGAGLGDGERI